jgi:methylphosphotriester-DNA--protein-cysteine methyltransferase
MAMHHPVCRAVKLVPHGPARTAATDRALRGGRAGFAIDGNTRIVQRKFVELRGVVENIEPTGFVRDVRLRRAAQLLQVTSIPMDSVVAKIGYSSRSHFSKAFSDQFGVSPAEFRKRYH